LFVEIICTVFRQQANEGDVLHLDSCAVYTVRVLSEGSVKINWAAWLWVALYHTGARYKQLLLLLPSDHLLTLKKQLTDFYSFTGALQKGHLSHAER